MGLAALDNPDLRSERSLRIYVVLSIMCAAEAARKALLHCLRVKLLTAIGSGQTRRADQITELIQDIESCEEGAFAPVTQQPVVRALMMPFNGADLVAALSYLASTM